MQNCNGDKYNQSPSDFKVSFFEHGVRLDNPDDSVFERFVKFIYNSLQR